MRAESEKYRRGRLLGKGSQGEVWTVVNKDTKAEAVMKLYKKESKEAERELAVLRQFGGKGIPYLIDCVEWEDKRGVVMELIEGKTLRILLKENALWKEEEALRIAMETAKILSRFHRQVPVVIYGDLKPENMMIMADGEVCLIDFGSVIYMGERNQRILGTRRYLAPETKALPHKDTYALGMILYEMLTGVLPIEGTESGKADISHISEDLRKIMQKAVRIHETEGYVNALEMYEDLKNCYERSCERDGKKKTAGKVRQRGIHKGKKHYFVTDIKRLVRHGCEGIICCGILLLMPLLWMTLQKQAQAAGAEYVLSEKIIGADEAGADYQQVAYDIGIAHEKGDTEEKETDKDIKKQEESTLRDAYGRKLVVRSVNGLTEGTKSTYNVK